MTPWYVNDTGGMWSSSGPVAQYIVVASQILRPLLCPLSTSLTTSLASLRSILTLLLLLLLSDSSASKLGEARPGSRNITNRFRLRTIWIFIFHLEDTLNIIFKMYKRLYINVDKGESRYVINKLAINGLKVSSFRVKSHQHTTMTRYNIYKVRTLQVQFTGLYINIIL